MLAKYMLKHSLPLKTFIPNFIAFLVFLGIARILHLEDLLLCHYRKAGHCLKPKIIQLPGGGHCPLANQIS